MTYSVVAHCSKTGQFGIATQSHYLAVGSVVLWARADAGAVAAQGRGNPMYGARGLELLAAGHTAEQALDSLLAEDDLASSRQVAFMGVDGSLKAHTGDHCIGYASHVVRPGVVFMGNVARNGDLPQAMAESWEQTEGEPLQGRLLEALFAAENAGGDLRGEQSAAIKICEPAIDGAWWNAVVVDVRVDDSPTPLTELRRLVHAREAYRLREAAEDADGLSGRCNAFLEVRRRLPNSAESAFWHGVCLANAGDQDGAKQALRQAYSEGDGWRELLIRLRPARLLNVSDDALAELTSA